MSILVVSKEIIARGMEEFQGYTKIAEVRIGKLFANLLAVLLAGALTMLCIWIVSLLSYRPGDDDFSSLVLLILMIPIIVIHEMLHAYAALKWGNLQRKDVKFGFNWKGLMPYCHLKVPIPVRTYRIVGLMPLWITGPIGIVILLIYPTISTAALTAFTLASCVGDLMMHYRLREFEGNLLVLDHPSEPGFDIYSPEISET